MCLRRSVCAPLFLAAALLPLAASGAPTEEAYNFQPAIVPGLPVTGNWSDVKNWNPDICLARDAEGKCVLKGYPGQITGVQYNVTVNSNAPFTTAVLSADASASVSGLTVGGSAQVDVTNQLGLNAWDDSDPNIFTWKTALLENAGLMNVSGSLYTNGMMTITGGGKISLPGGALTSGTASMSNVSTIDGVGSITGKLTNSGLIDARFSGAPLQITAAASSPYTRNFGTLRASNGGVLDLLKGGTGSLLVNGGAIKALDGSVVQLKVDTSGGTFSTAGTGVVRVMSNVNLTDVTNDGALEVADGFYLVLQYDPPGTSGFMTNNGAILLNSASSRTVLIVNGAISLSGTGVLQLLNSNSYVSAGNNSTLNHGPDHTIEGAGNLGVADPFTLELSTLNNQGLIHANVPGQRMLVRVGTTSLGAINNTGVLRASNGGIMELAITRVNNVSTGVVEALDNSMVDLNGASISFGTLHTEGTGFLKGRGASLKDLANNGLLVVNAGTTKLLGAIVNNGILRLNHQAAAGSFAAFGVDGNTTLTGPGVLEMLDVSDTTLQRINTSLGGTLINDVGHTIRGAGNIGFGGSLGLVNKGLMQADMTGALILSPTSGLGLTNDGTLKANSGSTLTILNKLNNYTSATHLLTGGTYHVAGTMRLPSGNTVNSNAAHVLLDGPGSNLYEGSAGTSQALAGFVNNVPAGNFEILNGRDFTTAAAFSNAGKVKIGAGGTFTVGGAGAYTQTAGNTDVRGTLSIPGGLLLAGGTLTGSGNILGGIVNSGQINPGGSPGTMTVTGDYSQPAGTLTIEIGAAAYDRLLVTGTATLGGMLDVQFWNAPEDPSFMGTPGTFDVLVAADILGGFDNVSLPPVPGGNWTVEYLKDAAGPDDVVRLTLVPEPATLSLLALGGLALLRKDRRAGQQREARRANAVHSTRGPRPISAEFRLGTW